MFLCSQIEISQKGSEYHSSLVKQTEEWGGGKSKVSGCLRKWGEGCGGVRSKVSPPSDISCATEAVTTRSAEVQVSERDD